MLEKFRRIGTSRVAVAAMAAVLASAGAAIAASDGDGNGDNGKRGDGAGRGHHGGMQGGPGGQMGGQMGGKYLTYAEAHTYKNGHETVMRTDAGKIKSVSDSEITLTERDGTDVTISLNEDTEVFIFGEEDATIGDLEVGKRVIVAGEKGQAADHVMVPPTRSQLKRKRGQGRGGR